MAPGAFIWLALVLAALSMWRLAREHLSEPYAIAAAIIYAINPYQLVIVYYRSAFGELLAAAFLPLTVWSAVRLIDGESGAILMFSLSFAAVWLSNAPAAVITTYALVIVLVVGAAQKHTIRPLLMGGTAMAGAVSLAAFYILPAAWEQKWVQIKQAVLENLQPSSNFLFTRTTDLDFAAFNWKISWVATGIIAATLLAILMTLRKRTGSTLRWILAALAAISVFLMLRPSLPLWRSVPKLWFIQFPWRWLVVLGLALAFFVAFALQGLPQKFRIVAAVGVFAILATDGVVLARKAYWDSSDIADIAALIQTDHGYEGTDEYTPLGCDRYQFPGDPDDSERPDDVSPNPAPRVAMLDSTQNDLVSMVGAAARMELWSSERKNLTVHTNRMITLAPRLVGYPAWEVQINRRSVNPELRSGTQQILLPIPPGSYHIEIRFRHTWDRKLGGAISIFTAALMSSFLWVKRMWQTGAPVSD